MHVSDAQNQLETRPCPYQHSLTTSTSILISMQQNKERKLEGFEVSLFQDVFATQKQ